jgi:hypothetical protein
VNVAIVLVATFAYWCAVLDPPSHTMRAVDPHVLERSQAQQVRLHARRALCVGLLPLPALDCIIAASKGE